MAGFKVPTKERQVAPQLLPAAQVTTAPTAEDFGAFEAQVAGQIGRGLTQAGEREQRREEAADVLRLEAKNERDVLIAKNNVIKYQDWWRNQEPTYTDKFGIDADGVTNQAIKDIKDFNKSITDKLENEEQKAKYLSYVNVLREADLNKTKDHEVTQKRQTRIIDNGAEIENLIRDARRNHQYPLNVSNYKNLLDDAIVEKIKLLGLPPKAARNVKDEIISAFHENILNEKVVLNAEEAQKYYDSNKKEILPENREAIEKVLNKENTKQLSQQEADRIMLEENDATKRVEDAREIKDPEVRDATVSRIKTRNEELDQLEKEKIIEVNDNILGAILKSNSKEEAEGYAFNAPTSEDIKKHLKTVEWFWKEKIGEEKVSVETMLSKEYNDILTNSFINISNGAYKSLSHLRHDTLGSLSDEDQKDVESFWKAGGLVGGINMSELRTTYKSFSDLDPQENRLAWNASLRYIQRRVANLPPGQEKISDVQLNNWMQQSVTKSADQGLIFKDKGQTFAQVEELGEEFGVDVQIDMTSEERESVKSLMEKGNKERIAAGLKPYPINEVTINRGFMNVIGAERIQKPTTSIISPIAGGTLAPAPPVVPVTEPTRREEAPPAPPVTPEKEPGEGVELKTFTDETFTEFTEENIDKVNAAIKERTGNENRTLATQLLREEVTRKFEEREEPVEKEGLEAQFKKAQETTEKQLEEAKGRAKEEDIEELEVIGKLQREFSEKFEKFIKKGK